MKNRAFATFHRYLEIDSSITSQNNFNRVSTVEHPLLNIGGSDDDIPPFSMAEMLMPLPHHPIKLVKIEGETHNDLPYFETYSKSLHAFIRK